VGARFGRAAQGDVRTRDFSEKRPASFARFRLLQRYRRKGVIVRNCEVSSSGGRINTVLHFSLR
jgi:hypothetical protein